MRRFLALVSARSKEFYRDQATLVWTFAFPFIVLLGFAYGYSGKDEPILKVGIFPDQSGVQQPLQEFLSIPQIQFVNYTDEKAALKRVERHQLDLFIKAPEMIYWINPESSKASLAERLLKTSIHGDSSRVQLKKQELTGKKLRYADWLVPGLISMNLMFSSLFGVGYVIVRYRKNGVLKRMRATPLSAFEFLAAQVFSRMLLLLITTALTLVGAVILIGFPVQGSVLDLMIFVGVGSTALISLGLLVAARLSSEEVADGVLNVLTWPMIFLSGIWFSLDGASPWVMAISKALPLTHIVDGVRAILIDGASLGSLVPQMIALGIASIVLLALGSLIFKWR